MPTDIAPITELVVMTRNTGIWQDDGAVKLYLYCLVEANHGTYLWYGVPVHPGEMPLLERHTAKALVWSRNKLDRKIELLREVGLIEIHTLSHHRILLRIVHWPHDEANDNMNGSTVEPPWLHDGANLGNPVFHDKAKWPQNGANAETNGSMMEPTWPHDGAKTAPIGSTTEPTIYSNNMSIYTSSVSSSSEPEGFTDIWIAYPSHRRTQRNEAARLIAKAFKDGATVGTILGALEEDLQSESWQKENGRYIPGIVKWLEKESWRSFGERSVPAEDPEKWTSL